VSTLLVNLQNLLQFEKQEVYLVVGGVVMLTLMMTKAFLLGLLGACAAGPLFMLVLHRSVSRGILYGIASALGISVVEGLCFTLAMAGTLTLAGSYPQLVQMFELVGGSILLIVGTQAIIGATGGVDREMFGSGGGLLWMALSSAIVTISNPFTILFYAGVATKMFPEFAGKVLPFYYFVYGGLAMTVGAFCAFLALSLLSGRVSEFFSTRFRRWVGLATGITFCLIATYLIALFMVSAFAL